MRKVTAIAAAVMMVFIFTMCAGTQVKVQTPAKLVIAPADAKVKIGKTVELTASVVDQDGKPVAVVPAWELNAADVKIGTLKTGPDSKVVFTGKMKGAARIKASAGKLSAEITVTVMK